jgi:MinD superfamily P-loop ATPase
MNCGKGVFTWTTQGPAVSNPNDCVVGCSTCGTLCEGNAITFPDMNELRALYKKEHLWAKVTRQMRELRKLTPND